MRVLMSRVLFFPSLGQIRTDDTLGILPWEQWELDAEPCPELHGAGAFLCLGIGKYILFMMPRHGQSVPTRENRAGGVI